MNTSHYLKALFLLIFLISCNKKYIINTTTKEITPSNPRIMAGGGTTIFSRTSVGFETPAPSLSAPELEKHLSGDAEFERKFVSAPAPLNPGLGSIFNNSSCISCHPKDGRAPFPKDISGLSGLLIRTSLPGKEADNSPKAVPGFGNQIQNKSIHRYSPEASYIIDFQNHTEALLDGTLVKMRKPILRFTETYAPLPPEALFSIRLAPPVFGLGLLEAIPESTIIANQDIDDTDKDGISGKANYVKNPFTKKVELGRFGWKANTADLLTQTASAYNQDMGITSHVFPKEPCFGQSNCAESDTTKPEVADEILDDVVFYTQTLGVPAPENTDNPEIVAGFRVFEEILCAKCHTPKMKTGPSSIKSLDNQEFFPFTDMLLHDMGEGLADHRPDFLANGREWKTRPLWGIGLTKLINGHTDYLHDGRARNVTEAIMWHGGEAESSKKLFVNLSTIDRANLLTFIDSL